MFCASQKYFKYKKKIIYASQLYPKLFPNGDLTIIRAEIRN